MLNACELANDLERAAQWCHVAEEFVSTYGCPFLHAECRIAYGTVLTAKGRWDDADRELTAGVRIAGGSPALHARGLSRLAALRVRQGRLEDAEQLLSLVGAASRSRPTSRCRAPRCCSLAVTGRPPPVSSTTGSTGWGRVGPSSPLPST